MSADLMSFTISRNSGSEWTLCLMVMRESPVATKLIFFFITILPKYTIGLA